MVSHLSLSSGSSITQPWSQDCICPSLLSPAACSVRAWHPATELEREGEARVSQWLSAFPADSTPLPPGPTHSLRPPNFPFPGLSCSRSHKGSTPSTTQGASSASGGCQQHHLGTTPTGLAGSRPGRFESAVMDCLEYRSRCSQKGPGEDHLTGMWVTQREGKGREGVGAGFSWPAGPGGGGQVVSSGRQSREEEAAGE